ncbi:unnamed protein product [Gadus morhua 'NCC']
MVREWPQQVGHEWERLIPHKHVRKWPPLLCAGDDMGGRVFKGAITKSFTKRGVTEGAAVTRPAVASNIHNPEQVVGVHYGEEDQGPVPRSSRGPVIRGDLEQESASVWKQYKVSVKVKSGQWDEAVKPTPTSPPLHPS